MIKSVGDFYWVLFLKPWQFVLTQRGESVLVQWITLNDCNFWRDLTLEPNDSSQTSSQYKLNNDHILKLSIRIFPMFLLLMTDIKMNKNMHHLSNSNDKEYVNELFETDGSEELPNVMTNWVFGDLFVLRLTVLFPQMNGVYKNRVT